ncbi:hypothetical protein HBI21_242450 [Parastagonospora nodorum]|nr:hypothetical protein HBI21_242450 [Parastagonospora nodorum]
MNLALLLNLQEARKRGNADRVNNNNNNLVRDNIEKLICVSKVKNNRNNLNIMVTDPTSREFGRVNMKSLTGLSGEGPLGSPFLELISMTLYKFYKGKNIQLIYVLRSVDEIQADVADVFNIVVSKLDEVLTRELSTLYFMWDKEQDYSAEEHDYRKFYYLVITSEDTHCKQIIKKVYIMLLERASLILFII